METFFTEAEMEIISIDDLHDKFEEVVTFNDTGFHKPAKQPFIRISKNSPSNNRTNP